MKMKKWLSLLLALVFCLGLLPMAAIPALAADAGTAGSLPNAVNVTINKVWVDGNNPLRPDTVQIEVQGGSKPIGIQLSARGNTAGTTQADPNVWTAEINNVETYDASGNQIDYTVREDVPQGYQCHTKKTVDNNGNITFTITNTLLREISITKVWDDNGNQDGLRPTEVEIQIQGGSQPYSVQMSARSSTAGTTQADPNIWTVTVNVPKYDSSGNEIDYTVQEPNVPAGYQSVVRDDSANGNLAFTITNTLQREIKITKVWNDGNDADGIRPQQVTVLLKGDSDVGKYHETHTAVLTADGGNLQMGNNGQTGSGSVPAGTAGDPWSYTFLVPVYANGEKIEYTAEEITDNVINGVDGPGTYASAVTGDADTGFKITNTHTPKTVNVTVTKVWEDGNNADGLRPDTVNFQLLADGQTVGTATLSDRQGNASGTAATGQTGSREWIYIWSNLPQMAGGQDIKYSVEERNVPTDYRSDVEGENANGEWVFTITNTLQREITVTKAWEDEDDADGLRPRSVTVQLFANDEACGNPVTLQAAGQNDANGTTKAANNRDWTYTWQVPVYLNGREIEYTVQETDVPKGYTAQVTGDAESGFTITNIHGPDTAEITVTKVWEDEDDADELRPESIQVNLTLGGNTWSQELSEGNKWTCSWEVPARDADVYTVAEDTVPTGYTAEVTGDVASGFTITNTHVPTGIGGGEDDPPPAPALPEELPDMEDFVPFLPPAGHAPSGPSEPAEPSEPSLPALNKEDHFAYIIGTADGYVLPEANITRAEVATIFFRLLTDESRAQIWSRVNSFPDVGPEDWYNNAVSTMANGGILKGYEDGTFRPMASITRAEFATIAIRFFRDDAAAEEQFSDVEGHWGEAYINMAAEKGLIKGYPDSSFRPDEPITRAEAITIINRLLERHPHKDKLSDGMIAWPDNADDSAWYYAEVQEATNSHAYEMEDGVERWTELLPVRDWAAFEKEWSTAFSAGNPGDVVSEDVEIDLDELGPEDDGEEAPEEAEPDNGEEPEDDQDEEDQDNQDNQDYGNNGGNG